MGVPAVAGVVLFASLAGVLLYLPFYLWAKRKLRPPRRERWFTVRITKAGALFYGLMVASLFGGFSFGHLAPDTTVGHYMKSGVGRLSFGVVLIIAWTIAEAILRRRGFEFYRQVDGDDKR